MTLPARIFDQGPSQILATNRAKAIQLSTKVGLDKLHPILQKAEKDLQQRLSQASGLKGPGSESFTAAKLQSILTQVRAVLVDVKSGIKSTTLTTGKTAAELAAQSTIEYLGATQQKFRGIHQPLQLDEAALYDRATRGAESSLLHRLQGDPKKGPGILARYGAMVVENFEGVLQQRFLAQTPWDETRQRLIAASPFLQSAPAHWAERIVRTEVMNSHGASAAASIDEAQDQLGDMVKILSCVFDDRTGADSIAVHGQIRRPNEPFNTWFGPIAHPPDRPNDRGVVVPHRISWPIPDALAPRSNGEVMARWQLEGRKGSPPARPLMTTVPLSEFGKVQPKVVQAAPEKAIPEYFQQPAIQLAQPMPLGEQLGFQFGEHPKPMTMPPPPPPQIIAPEIPRADQIMGEKIGEQAGSNLGGLYRGTDGTERYVKFYKDPAQAELEHLANELYSDLGVGTVKSEVFKARHPETGDVVTAYASTILQGETLKSAGLTPKAATTVMKGFAADVLSANWDAVGMGLDNILVHSKSAGALVDRIDKGGTFLFRAKAGRKPIGVTTEIPEWEGFFNPSVNPDYARVAKEAGVTSAEQIKGLAGQIKKVVELSKQPGGWNAYVTKHAPNLSHPDHVQTVAMLEKRTDLLKGKLKTLVKKRVAGPPKLKPGERLEFKHLPVKHLEHVGEPLGGWKGRYNEFRTAEERKVNAWARAHPDQRMVVSDYKGNGYHALLDTKRMTPEAWKSKYGSKYSKGEFARKQEEYAAMRSAFRDAPLAVERSHPMAKPGELNPEAMITDLYRGEHGISDANHQTILDKFASGQAHEFGSVISTSYGTDTAKSFGYEGGSRGENAILYHIKTKPSHEGKLLIDNSGESEVLLDEDRRFRITGAHKMSGRDKTLLVELEELEPGEAPKTRSKKESKKLKEETEAQATKEAKEKEKEKATQWQAYKNGHPTNSWFPSEALAHELVQGWADESAMNHATYGGALIHYMVKNPDGSFWTPTVHTGPKHDDEKKDWVLWKNDFKYSTILGKTKQEASELVHLIQANGPKGDTWELHTSEGDHVKLLPKK